MIFENKRFEFEKHAGYVVGNSILAAEVTPSGRMFSNIRFNPCSFDFGTNYIRSGGEAGFIFEVNGKKYRDCDIKWSVSEKIYPRYSASTVIDGLKINVDAFAPIRVNDENMTFCPAIITRFSFDNRKGDDKKVSVSFGWKSDELDNDAEYEEMATNLFCGIESDISYIAATKCEDYQIEKEKDFLSLKVNYDVYIDTTKTVAFAFGNYATENKFRSEFVDTKSLASFIFCNIDGIKRDVDDFVSLIPTVCSPKIAEYTRWYLQAAVMLTKADKNGNLITMGYNELNQRDSFWTSFLHLAFFPELEKQMIRISYGNMQMSGKVPTTILPLIEREYDIDINEYFCIRIARYYKFHHDYSFLRETFGYFKKAVDFLISMDKDGDGVPEQCPPENTECYWADWKDVSYIIGRKLAPHFALLWLAVLKEGKKLAEVMGENDVAEKYGKLYETAYEKINRDYDGTDNGGLWNGNFYTEQWYDGRKIENVLQDQTVGMFFGVVPQERADKIYESLKANECEYGVRETFPYRTESYDEGGLYHNGGIWPWLMFCDMTGRFKYGHGDDAVRLIEKLGYYDLEKPGDMRPNEYLHGESGENCGFEVQGWSAAIIGTIYFGLFDIKNDGDGCKVGLNYTGSDFETKLVLPTDEGVARVTCKDGKVSVEK